MLFNGHTFHNQERYSDILNSVFDTMESLKILAWFTPAT